MEEKFVERLIGIYRTEPVNRSLFWNKSDLQNKLDQYQDYFNEHRSQNSNKSSLIEKIYKTGLFDDLLL